MALQVPSPWGQPSGKCQESKHPPQRTPIPHGRGMSHLAYEENQTNPICPEEDAQGQNAAPTPSGLPRDQRCAHVCACTRVYTRVYVCVHTQPHQLRAQLLEDEGGGMVRPDSNSSLNLLILSEAPGRGPAESAGAWKGGGGGGPRASALKRVTWQPARGAQTSQALSTLPWHRREELPPSWGGLAGWLYSGRRWGGSW